MLINIQLLPVPQKWVNNYEADLVPVNIHICLKIWFGHSHSSLQSTMQPQTVTLAAAHDSLVTNKQV
jgi:hypothetical protein